jgi:hypothetical protein
VKLRGWIVGVVGLVACLGAAYAAYQLADYSWNQVVDYRGPYAKAALPPAQPMPTASVGETAGLTVFVIVDGLREDVSRTMPNLENLRTRGYDAVVKTAQPSLSFPNWTTLLSGAPQRISGVTTNWFEEKVPVETLVDVAVSTGATVAVSAPTDFQMLYDVKRTGHTYLRDWVEGEYMTDDIVDNAIRLGKQADPSLLIVHFPDIDEAGHAHGGGSKQYRDMALKVDADLGRLIGALQAAGTTFVVAADHGHIATGGHGGPEAIVTEVPAVFAGPRVKMGSGTGEQDQVAPTVAVLAGLPIPRNAAGEPLDVAVGEEWRPAAEAQQFHAYDAYIRAVFSGPVATSDLETGAAARRAFDAATASRLSKERSARIPLAAALAVACLLAIVVVGVLSWRALTAALAGLVAYYAVWDGSYFLLHGYRWSLSSFNSEALLKGFLNGRMIDAVLAGVVAGIVAALVYAWLHRGAAERPATSALWSIGVATVLVIQATLGIQVAWYLWYWGASVSWVIPDLALGFKYDLDLIQLTGLGAAALLAPLAAFLVARVALRRAGGGEAAAEV